MNLLDKLVEQLQSFPSIGKKTAQRMAYFLLQEKESVAEEMAETILQARKKIKHCVNCFHYTDEEYCLVCLSPQRKRNLICVVERPEDLITIEQYGYYQGVYHVVGGVISPIDGIGPEQLELSSLKNRISKLSDCEIMLALSTSLQGETTSLYIKGVLEKYNVKISSLARGIPMGSDLQFVDKMTMQKAMENRIHL